MPKEHIPNWIIGYWTETPTEYTSDDIVHLEPDSLSTVYLKSLALKSVAPPVSAGFLRTNTGGYFLTNTGGKFRLN